MGKFKDGKKIIITTDGVTTLARLFDGCNIINEAMAKCSPDDEFDFETGAALAFRRLREKMEKKPKYYNGKVVCVEKKLGACYTVGKVYEFKDGKVVIDNGCEIPVDTNIKNLEEWNKSEIYLCKFIPFVEG